jgi:hypothetical protein
MREALGYVVFEAILLLGSVWLLGSIGLRAPRLGLVASWLR